MGSIQPVIYAREYSFPLFQALLIRESSPLWNTADFHKVCYTLPTKNMEYLEKTMEALVLDILFSCKWYGTNQNKYCD